MHYQKKLTPWLYLLPALILISCLLIFPVIKTIVMSFFDNNFEKFVGIENYKNIFQDSDMKFVFRNNFIWIFVFTSFTVFFGLTLAILSDKIHYEKVAKSIIFMPMAISAAGASVIWKFVYSYRPEGMAQIGLLNAIVSTFGGEPRPWLTVQPLNTILIIIVGIWMWTGFAMTILSASYKNISKEYKEAAVIEGASGRQVLFFIVLPLMKSSIISVTTTVAVFVLKIFDFVYVMTNGNFNTEVIANKMFKAMFQYNFYGKASALAVLLFILTIPIVFLNSKLITKK